MTDLPRVRADALRAALLQMEGELSERGQGKLTRFFRADGPYRRELYPKHMAFFAAGKTYRERGAISANRVGKAQPIDTPVLTPSGWRPIGTIQTGDEVIGGDGYPVMVRGVFPQGVRPVVNVVCSDGSVVPCDEGHLWRVRNVAGGRLGSFEVESTQSLDRRMLAGERFALPQRPCVEFQPPENELPVDPYLLGLLIGDGGYSCVSVYLTTADEEIAEYCRAVAGRYACAFIRSSKMQYRFATMLTCAHVNILAELLKECGLHGKTSREKRIPQRYFAASSDDRVALLQGLMDTDGTVGVNGQRSYSSVSRELCEDVCELARSLGHNASVTENGGQYNGRSHQSWQTYIGIGWGSVFRLRRKVNREKDSSIARRPVMIERIVPAEDAECVCLNVENDDGLYITVGHTVTHNSLMAAFETTLHLTGLYPDWWPGRRFTEPVNWWVCGDTATTVRDIMQGQLLGRWGELGTGFIPRHLIIHHVPKRGVANAIDTVWVRHATGGRSELQFKSYESGRKGFQGTSQHGIQCDEEPPYDCYEECLIRTTKTSDFPGGMLMLTFTPLSGLTDVVREFYPRQVDQEDAAAPIGREEAFGAVPGIAKRFRVRITWDDVPHLTEEEKADFLSRLRPYQREARTRGVPQLGSGAIYPFPVSEFRVPHTEIPEHWARGFALDAQALWKSSLHGAFDRETGIWYIYSEYKREMASTPDHATAILERGPWIPGVGDASGLVREGERTQYIDLYRSLGLDVELAEKSVEPGIQDVYDLFSKGSIKVFSSCVHFFDEFETYQRNAHGRVIKMNDHLMDSLRMLVRGHYARGDHWMKTVAEGVTAEADPFGSAGATYSDGSRSRRWMG